MSEVITKRIIIFIYIIIHLKYINYNLINIHN